MPHDGFPHPFQARNDGFPIHSRHEAIQTWNVPLWHKHPKTAHGQTAVADALAIGPDTHEKHAPQMIRVE